MSKRIWIVSVILVIALIGLGSYLYFKNHSSADVAGSTIVDSDNIVYVTLPDELANKVKDKTSDQEADNAISKLVEDQINSKFNNKNATKNLVSSKNDGKNIDFIPDAIVVFQDKNKNPIIPSNSINQRSNQYQNNDLSFEFDNTWSDGNKLIVQREIDQYYTKIKDLIGNPYTNDTIQLTYDPRQNETMYYISTKHIVFNSMSSFTVIHEIVHAFNDLTGSVGQDVVYEEGIAEFAAQNLLNIKTSDLSPNYDYEKRNSLYLNVNFAYNNYFTSSYAFSKLYLENHDFLKQYREKYFDKVIQCRRPNTLYCDTEKMNFARATSIFESVKTVENIPIHDWYEKQHVFHHSFDINNYNKYFIDSNYDRISPSFAEIEIGNYENKKNNFNIKIFNYDNNLIKNDNITIDPYFAGYFKFNSNGEINRNINQRIKYIINVNDQVIEDYEAIINTVDVGQRGIYGASKDVNFGEISILGLDNNIQLTTTINNGAFVFGDKTIPEGRYQISYNYNNKIIKKNINKTNGDYYSLLVHHDNNDKEVSEIINRLDKSQVKIIKVSNLINSVLFVYKLPKEYINYASIIDYQTKNYYETQVSNTNGNGNAVQPFVNNSSFEYDLIAFLPDGYMVKVEKKYPFLPTFNFLSGLLSSQSVTSGEALTVKCNFNNQIDTIGVEGFDKPCKFQKFEGNDALFSCSAPINNTSQAISKEIKCSESSSNSHNSIGNLIIKPKLSNNAQIKIPPLINSTLVVNQSSPVTIKVKNNGTTTWTKGAYKLGVIGDKLTFGSHRVELTNDVAPNQEAIFNFNIIPNTVGPQTLQYQMVQEGVAWFGDKTNEMPITVNSAVKPCIPPKPTAFSVRPTDILTGDGSNPNENTIVSCDYGRQMDSIVLEAPNNPGQSKWNWVGWNGTAALFKVSSAVPLIFQRINCKTITGTAANSCARTDFAGTLNVALCSRPPKLPAKSAEATSLITGQTTEVSCDYGKQIDSIMLDAHKSVQWSFKGWRGTTALFNVKPTQMGNYQVKCKTVNYTPSRTCATDPIPVKNLKVSVCNNSNPTAFSISPKAVNINQSFTTKCNFGPNAGDSITANGNGITCKRIGYEGLSTVFSCIAPSRFGSYSVNCNTVAGTSANVCPLTRSAGTLTVNKPWWQNLYFWKK